MRTLATQSALYAFAGALNKVLALVTVPILTRALSPPGYGIAELATTLAALLTAVALFGADMPAARLAATASQLGEKTRVYTSYVASIVGLGLLAGAAVWVFSSNIAAGLWASPSAVDLARLVGLLIPVAAARGALVTIQRIQGRAGTFAILATVDLVAKLTLAVVFVLTGQGPAGVVRGFLLGNVVGLAAALSVTWRALAMWPSKDTAARLLAGGLAFLPSVIAFLLADYAIRFIVADRMGIAAVGQLAAAARVASVIGLATAAFSLAWGPYAIVRATGKRTQQLFGSVLTAFGAASVAVALPIGLLGREIITLLSGDQFSPGAAALPGLVLAGALAGPVFILLVATGVGGRTMWAGAASLFGAAVQLGLGLLLIGPTGLTGVGIAATAGQLAALAIALVTARGVVKARWGILAVSLAGAVFLSVVAAVLSTDGDGSRLLRIGILIALAAGLAAIARPLFAIGRALGTEWTHDPVSSDARIAEVRQARDEA
jgi:O-antigen/teichoic acid export membrane protein